MTDFIRRQMRQMTLASLCVIPASLIPLTCIVLWRQSILIFPLLQVADSNGGVTIEALHAYSW